MQPEESWSLLACGRAGQTEVDILGGNPDHTGALRYSLELSTSEWSLSCTIEAPGLIDQLVSFLSDQSIDSIQVGSLRSVPLTIRRDREFDDRFFIVAGNSADRIELTVAGEAQISELKAALSRACDDLRIPGK